MQPRLHWLLVGITILLSLALTACFRSASNAMTTMTPLPSVPPPTPTDILPTQTTAPLVTATRSETATSAPTKKATATKAQPTISVTGIQGSTTCEGAPLTRLSVGLFAYVNPEPPLPNNLRSAAGENNELIGYIEPGQAMEILAGPECADGWMWWKIHTLETDLTGWTAEGDGDGYWLVPCPSREECAP